MKWTKIEQVFGQEVEIDKTYPFRYVPTAQDKLVKGVLITEGVEVSLAFSDGTRLLLHKQDVSSRGCAPDQRIIWLHEELEGQLVQGLVKTPKFKIPTLPPDPSTIDMNSIKLPVTRASVYLLIEKEDEYG